MPLLSAEKDITEIQKKVTNLLLILGEKAETLSKSRDEAHDMVLVMEEALDGVKVLSGMLTSAVRRLATANERIARQREMLEEMMFKGLYPSAPIEQDEVMVTSS